MSSNLIFEVYIEAWDERRSAQSLVELIKMLKTMSHADRKSVWVWMPNMKHWHKALEFKRIRQYLLSEAPAGPWQKTLVETKATTFERRRSPRFNVKIEAKLITDNHKEVKVKTSNISLHGLQITENIPQLQKDSIHKLVFKHPKDKNPIEITVKVLAPKPFDPRKNRFEFVENTALLEARPWLSDLFKKAKAAA